MKSAAKSNRYMTRRQVAEHYCVDESSIRKPSPGSPFAQLRRVNFGRSVRYLRSDVDALDRRVERGLAHRSMPKAQTSGSAREMEEHHAKS